MTGKEFSQKVRDYHIQICGAELSERLRKIISDEFDNTVYKTAKEKELTYGEKLAEKMFNSYSSGLLISDPNKKEPSLYIYNVNVEDKNVLNVLRKTIADVIDSEIDKFSDKNILEKGYTFLSVRYYKDGKYFESTCAGCIKSALEQIRNQIK